MSAAYSVIYSKNALKDVERLKSAGLDKKAKSLIDIIKRNPCQNPPPYEKLIGDFAGYYSRRINIQHRLVYKVDEEQKTIKIYRLWSHYE
jgi:Txe/YoeB family toxin of toxin-antitoxin system